ncbi:hypothetical protein F5X96DRAFT_665812 [Biscogniauxia mediterranea]|nr:hypothetical protein F5X96DRAFT_665812 [Biscogniauxia mediterranea]
MQLASTIFSALLAAAAGPSAVLAAPAAPVSTFAAAEWTIQSLSRTCSADGAQCVWDFGVWTGEEGSEATACVYVVNATDAAPATQASGGPAACGVYTVTSGWSDQFGADQAFTTLSVVDYPSKLIVYPAYTDAQLANATVVEPDLSFPVQTLP